MRVNVRERDDEAGAYGSVTAKVPLVDFAPGQESPAPPPVAEQLLAFAELHVNVIDWPAVKDAGKAVRDTEMTGQLARTDI